MIVGMDLRRFPLGIFEGCLRQRLERRPFDLFEQFASAFADMALLRPVLTLNANAPS
jgi:hypothetical protein